MIITNEITTYPIVAFNDGRYSFQLGRISDIYFVSLFTPHAEVRLCDDDVKRIYKWFNEILPEGVKK